MGRLIDADLLMEAYLHDKKSGAVSMVKLIEEAPTVDAVEVVRCKDYKYFAGEGMYCTQDIIVQYDHFYCYHGEMNEEVEE